jgi:hypothetical protein
MDTKKMTEAAILKDAMDSFPKKDYKKIREEIQTACGVEYYTLINWRNGCCRIPDDKKEKIEEVLGAKIFRNSRLGALGTLGTIGTEL